MNRAVNTPKKMMMILMMKKKYSQSNIAQAGRYCKKQNTGTGQFWKRYYQAWQKREHWIRLLVVKKKLKEFLKSFHAVKKITLFLLVSQV